MIHTFLVILGFSGEGISNIFVHWYYELDQAPIPEVMAFRNVFVTTVYLQESPNLHFFSLYKEALTLQKTSVMLAAVCRC